MSQPVVWDGVAMAGGPWLHEWQMPQIPRMRWMTRNNGLAPEPMQDSLTCAMGPHAVQLTTGAESPGHHRVPNRPRLGAGASCEPAPPCFSRQPWPSCMTWLRVRLTLCLYLKDSDPEHKPSETVKAILLTMSP
jgi:hypothetical protein